MNPKSISLLSQSSELTALNGYHVLFWVGLIYQLLALFNVAFLPAHWGGPLSLCAAFLGLTLAGLYAERQKEISHRPLYQTKTQFVKINPLAIALLLTLFYSLLYLKPQWLGLSDGGLNNTGLIALYDGLSISLKGKPASEWFVYGVLYTMVILSMGIRFLYKFRHNPYQVYRTSSILFFQLCFAFLIPEILQSLNKPYVDFKNFWPLQYYFYFDWNIDQLLKSGRFGIFVLIWGTLGFLVITPILTYYFGKRWYCSWVCGCGGLAETAGDSLRSLSVKTKKAWQWEKALIYAILVLVMLMTILVLITQITGKLTSISYPVSHYYGLLIGAVFSGIIGVGFYPILGARIWCRYGCPMAAYLGILQKHFSRFRITTNHGQCISCGNCSAYCEMGIDVKSYAQRGADIKRASCVGCGICSAVCPRGVLRLENK
jgi:Pyruvate/2-oxoacid:ferredoxin oxidoreductase delta subunit/cytochrome c oxidase subunit IV